MSMPNGSERLQRYAAEIARLYAMHADCRIRIARAVMAVADDEHRELRAALARQSGTHGEDS